MPLYKSSQLMDAHDDFDNFGDEDEVIIYEEKPSKDDVIEMHQPSEIEISFKLPPLPGSDAEIPLEVSTDDAVEVEDKNDFKADKEVLEVKDPSDYRSYKAVDLPRWAYYMLTNIPRHSGRDTIGIERCIAYLKRFDTDMSKAITSDFKGEADISKLEEARKETHSAIERLEDALEKLYSNYKRKKSDHNSELVKEGKQTHVGGIIITVPLLISRLARVCINGMVSGGHDIESLYDRQVEEYGLNKREQVELLQLLEDMGYAMPRRDRGYTRDKEIDYTSSDNMDLAANYPA